jgi:hypothetical protein
VSSTRYEIHIRGRLSAPVLSAFDGLYASIEPVETVLCGDIEDQAALYGHLQRIQSLGLELVEVRRVADSRPEIQPNDGN